MSELPSGWEWARLGDLLQVRYGKPLPQANRSDDAPFPVVASAGVMTFTTEPLASGPTIVIGRKGNVGSIQVFDHDSWPIDTVFYASVPTGMDLRFLAYHLQYLQLSRYDSSTSTPSLRREDLESVHLTVPPIAEQRRIVAALEEHLSRLDSGTATLRATARRLQRLRDQVIAAGCAGSFSVTKGAGAPPPPHVGLHDGSLPLIPQHWRWARLNEIADVVGGVTKDSKKQADPTLAEVPYLRVANVQRGHIDLATVTTIRVSEDKIEQLALRPGDVLLNEGGDRDKLARGWIWEGQLPLCIHQNHVFRARVKDVLDSKLLAWHANSFGKMWAEANGKQSVNLASISLSKIRLLPVPIPPKAEQSRIVAMIEEHLDALDHFMISVSTAENRAKQLRSSLLAEAFAGRLVPQDPDDEPASVLLERVRAERAAQPKPKRARRTPLPDTNQEPPL